MAKTVADVMKMVKENEVKFVDFRFTDTRGKEQHVTVPVSHFDEDKFSDGHAFDGSSIAGWKGIEASDMLLMPDPNTANVDPFYEEPTLFLTCDVLEPGDGKAYDRDPRSIAKRAEAYLKASGVGDTAYFGPEPEFSFSTASAGAPSPATASIRSKNTKPPGIRVLSWKAATAATARPPRAAISRCLRSTARTTCAPRCRSSSNRWAFLLKCSTTKWLAPARWNWVPSSPRWCSALTGRRC